MDMSIKDTTMTDTMYDAQDARIIAYYEARDAYDALIRELQAVEVQTGVALVDVNADAENSAVDGLVYDQNARFWQLMLASASSAAGFRAEDAGLDINVLIGRTIY